MEQRAEPLPLFPGAAIPEARSPRARRRVSSVSPIEETARAQFRPLACSTILNRSPNPQFAFHFTINPYRGCEFGCSYCYARRTHEYLEERDLQSFESKIYVKFQAAAALADTLKTVSLRGKPVALGTATDPYQPGEKRFRITRRLLEVLAEARDLDLSITTKSPLVLRDIDLLQRIASRGSLTVQISLVTIHRSLSRIVERYAPSPRRRLETIRALRNAGIDAGMFVMPILPGITDSEAELRHLLREARIAGALFASPGVVRLYGPAARVFGSVIEKHFPHLSAGYRRMIASGGSFSSDVRDPILERFKRLRLEAGFEGGDPAAHFHASRSTAAGGETGWLFDPDPSRTTPPIRISC